MKSCKLVTLIYAFSTEEYELITSDRVVYLSQDDYDILHGQGDAEAHR